MSKTPAKKSLGALVIIAVKAVSILLTVQTNASSYDTDKAVLIYDVQQKCNKDK